MVRLLLSIALAGALAGCTSPAADPLPASAGARASPSAGGDPDHPVLVELYQSQGCSSCPPAIANVNALADRPDVLPLIFSVTYWDRLGWTDTFGDPAYTRRQWDYAKASGRTGVFTPQVVVNGGPVLVGNVAAELDQAIAQAGPLTGGPAIRGTGDAVVVAAGRTRRPLTVWLVRYDPRSQQVAIGAGENGGRTLAHRNVVRQLVELGRWTGPQTRFAVSGPADAHYRAAVLLQSGEGGPVVAARRI